MTETNRARLLPASIVAKQWTCVKWCSSMLSSSCILGGKDNEDRDSSVFEMLGAVALVLCQNGNIIRGACLASTIGEAQQ